MKSPTVANRWGVLRNGTGISHFSACNILSFFC